MVEQIGGWCILVAAAVIVLWVAWAVMSKFFPKLATGTTGTIIGKGVDISQFVAIFTTINAIRWDDAIAGDPEGVKACETIVRLAWAKVWSTAPTPALTTDLGPTIAALQAEVTSLKAKVQP